ncbi:hypothetical protein POSPLADRAFT_1161250, partial [Postia placenta MAD-698-R-SB12]
ILRTDQLRTDQHAQPALISPSLGLSVSSPSLRLGGAHPFDTIQYYMHLPFLPPSIMAEEAFNCTGLEHAFNAEDHVDVARLDDPGALFFDCNRQPCPNCTPRSITVEDGHFVPIRQV